MESYTHICQVLDIITEEDEKRHTTSDASLASLLKETGMNITHDMSNDLTEYDPESRQVDGPNPIENRISSSAARVPDIISCTSGHHRPGPPTPLVRVHHGRGHHPQHQCRRPFSPVYPFTGEPSHHPRPYSPRPQAPAVSSAWGGGTTTGPRVIQLAMMAEMQGAAGVVLNAPAPPSTVYDVARITNTPGHRHGPACDDELDEKIEAGASIINVGGRPQDA